MAKQSKKHVPMYRRQDTGWLSSLLLSCWLRYSCPKQRHADCRVELGGWCPQQGQAANRFVIDRSQLHQLSWHSSWRSFFSPSALSSTSTDKQLEIDRDLGLEGYLFFKSSRYSNVSNPPLAGSVHHVCRLVSVRARTCALAVWKWYLPYIVQTTRRRRRISFIFAA